MKKKKVAPKSKKAQKFSYGEVVILGLTGSLGSGCSYIAKGIKSTLGADGRYYKLSEALHERLEKSGVSKPTIKQLQDDGNRLRDEKGLSVLAEICLEKIKKESKTTPFNENTVLLIDGIRNDGEVRCLQAFPNFYLISVHADKDTRMKRLVGSKATCKKFNTKQEFEEADERDQEENIVWGQQVNKCNYLADIIINNNVKFTKGTAQEQQFFQKLIREYILTMRAVRRGSQVLDNPPSINETLMTMAYCVSKRSSCQKRKVGAVIACVSEYDNIKNKVKREEDEKRFQIISSGYNEVPLGTAPCSLGDYEECYRDYIKEKLAKGFKNCPKCGQQIPKRAASKLELFSDYKCTECETNIFKSYLFGAVRNAGKLLDLCRALHAEETAIIGLAGKSKFATHNESTKIELVLYTTTFPCNLCANKIVEAGISRVWYAEPYTMEEAKNILDGGGVHVQKFEGVKSTAYFRLFS